MSNTLVKDWKNNPFGIDPRRTRETGAAYNTNFGDAVYRTPRDATSRRIVDPTVTYANLDNADLIHAPIDDKHYGNDFVRKFIDQKFADVYDIGKSSVYRSQEDIDRDTLRIINEMKVYDDNPDINSDSEEYNQRMNYYEDKIKNPSRTTFNYDFKGIIGFNCFKKTPDIL
jgi:hypothetical protein